MWFIMGIFLTRKLSKLPLYIAIGIGTENNFQDHTRDQLMKTVIAVLWSVHWDFPRPEQIADSLQ
jgi:hypothetical protein